MKEGGRSEGEGAGVEDEEVSDDEVVWEGVAWVTADLRGAALDGLTCVPSLMGGTMDVGRKAIGDRGGDDNPEDAEAEDEALRLVPRGEESWVIGASGLFRFGEAGPAFSDGLPATLEISSWIEEELRDMVGVTARRGKSRPNISEMAHFAAHI